MLNRIIAKIVGKRIKNIEGRIEKLEEKLNNHQHYSHPLDDKIFFGDIDHRIVRRFNELQIKCGITDRIAGMLLRYVGKKYFGDDFMDNLIGKKYEICQALAVSYPDYFKKLADLYSKNGFEGFKKAFEDLETLGGSI